MDLAKVDAIIEEHNSDVTALLAIMQDVQEMENYLPREAVERIAVKLNIPISKIYSMATFYESFHLEPRGKHICKVCVGTACHVRGATRILEQIERDLEILSGETTADGQFTIEEVNCVGACALGPLVIIDKDYHGNMTPASMSKVLKKVTQSEEGGK
ncbi:MAG: NADH-quinone oxidoreductase subunit NuoE [Deltaproteobacteria bacterium]|nr:NADH-quinone oxidoreductase subunit NuoE [Deltaproteobacteria bacterium]